MPEASSILNSWKEIASYLGRGVRTVQRWHRTLQLPVHRINPRNDKAPVFAYKKELDRWMQRQARQCLTNDIEQQRAAIKDNGKKFSAIGQRLNLWRTASQSGQELKNNLEQTRQLGFKFMSIDLDVALTLAEIAEHASDSRKRTRHEASARRALQTVLDLYRESKLTDDERKFLKSKIADVRAALECIRPTK